MRRVGCLITILILGTAVKGSAEVVHFKNGDHLTGKLERVLEGRMMFNSEALGNVTIPTDKIASYSTADPVIVLLKKDRAVRGRVALNASGQWEVYPPSGGKEVLSPKSVEAVYPIPVFTAGTTEHHARPFRFWKGNGNLGYTLENGDQSARILAVGVSAVRIQPQLPGLTERFRTNYSLNLLLASTTTFQGVSTKANSVTTALRQDFFFSHSKNNFFFLLGQLDHIGAQSLDLRQSYGAGFGRDLVRSRRLTFSFLGGSTYVRERFLTRPVAVHAEGLLGEKLSIHPWTRLGLENQISFYPRLSALGNQRMDMSTIFSSPITPRLSLQTGITDHYLSQPLPGHKKNDLIVTMGIGFQF